MNADTCSEILDGFSDAAFMVDPARKLLAANQSARRVFGVEPTGQDFVRVMRRPEVLSLIDRVLRGEARAQDVMRLDSALRGTFRVTVARVQDEGAIISFADLSPLREAEQMRSDFVANVSHELRSPLTALSGFIETLKGPASSDPSAQGRFLDLMEREAARMNRLIADLLSLSRVEVEARVRPTAPVDIKSVVSRVIATLSLQAERETVHIELDAPSAAITIEGDEDQLMQVFQNLIENAIKYGGSGKIVSVAIRQRPSAPGMRGAVASIEVADEGPGVPPEHVPRLTERFYRVDAGRSRDKGGTGLGLAIVKHIVQRHRGRLLIESEPGAGATFTVLLPVAGAT
ncbi:MAG: ATP-binding protein [Pseudomonadota bacterium]